MGTRLAATALVAAMVSSAGIARAETCHLNVCEVLAEDLWIPPTISEVLECDAARRASRSGHDRGQNDCMAFFRLRSVCLAAADRDLTIRHRSIAGGNRTAYDMG
jgi:hypothetical protein